MADADVHRNNQFRAGLPSPGCLSTTAAGGRAGPGGGGGGVKRGLASMMAQPQTEEDKDRVKKILSLVKVLLIGEIRNAMR